MTHKDRNRGTTLSSIYIFYYSFKLHTRFGVSLLTGSAIYTKICTILTGNGKQMCVIHIHVCDLCSKNNCTQRHGYINDNGVRQVL